MLMMLIVPLIMTMLLRSITSALVYMKMIGADHDGDDNDEDHLDDDYFILMSMVVKITLVEYWQRR